MTRLIEAKGLCAGYGSVPAIVDVDLHLDAGEMVGLLGANGAGKTTTLMALAGVVKATSGAVSLFGRTDGRAVFLGPLSAPRPPTLPLGYRSPREILRSVVAADGASAQVHRKQQRTARGRKS